MIIVWVFSLFIAYKMGRTVAIIQYQPIIDKLEKEATTITKDIKYLENSYSNLSDVTQDLKNKFFESVKK